MSTEEDRLKQIQELEQVVKEAEARLSQAKVMLQQVAGYQVPHVSLENGPEHVIMGVFNGECMVDDQKKQYPVPANYASKSKLVEGDQLKLTITANGSFVYKQIGPVPRKRSIAKIVMRENGYYAQSGTESYKLLMASVTYFKLNINDEITVLSPLTKKSEWAAIENIISQGVGGPNNGGMEPFIQDEIMLKPDNTPMNPAPLDKAEMKPQAPVSTEPDSEDDPSDSIKIQPW